MNNVYRIPVELFEKFEVEVNRLNKKAEKLKGKKIEFEILNNTVFEKKGNIDVPCIEVYVKQHEDLTIGGYEYCGKLERISKDEFVSYGLKNVPENQKNISTCQHCNANRNRKYLYVLKNIETGEYKTVGKSCLEDFTGIKNAEKLAEFYQDFEDDIKEYDYLEGSFWSGFNPNVFSIDQSIRASIVSIKERGYKKSDCEDMNTKTHVKLILEHYNDGNSEYQNLFDKAMEIDQSEIDEMKALILEEEDKTEFIINLKKLISCKYVKGNMMGFVAYVPEAVNKIKQRKLREKLLAEKNSKSGYIGEIKDKIELDVIFDRELIFDSLYGGSTKMYFFLDENSNVLVWKTSTVKFFEVGEKVRIKATVKSHEEYKGCKQTFVVRAKFS